MTTHNTAPARNDAEVGRLITHARAILDDMSYAEDHGYPLTRTLDELQAALDSLRAESCRHAGGHITADHRMVCGDCGVTVEVLA